MDMNQFCCWKYFASSGLWHDVDVRSEADGYGLCINQDIVMM